MTKLAAGLLMCRFSGQASEFFLVNPGRPHFKKKNAGWWTIPKGIPEPDEDLFVTAQREFFEETGIHCSAPYFDIGNIRQKGGKVVKTKTTRPPPEDLVVFCKPKTIIFVP